MEVYSVDITAWTSSFRIPILISGTQLTLRVPPLSTMLGLINAAAGKRCNFLNTKIGYYFDYLGEGVDIATEIMIAENPSTKGPSNRGNPNVIKRQILADVFLRLYSTREELIRYFKDPFYPILLGRSSDLATVDMQSFRIKELRPIKNANLIKGQIVPYRGNFLAGSIHALPQYFTDDIPRENLGNQPYSVVNWDADIESTIAAYRDEIKGKEVDIYFHEIDFE